MAQSLQEQLDSVSASIERTLNGQSWQEGRRMLTNPPLQSLFARYDKLNALVNRAPRSPFRLARLSRPAPRGS